MFRLRSQSWTNLAMLPPPQGKMNHNRGFHKTFANSSVGQSELYFFFVEVMIAVNFKVLSPHFFTKNLGVLLYI